MLTNFVGAANITAKPYYSHKNLALTKVNLHHSLTKPDNKENTVSVDSIEDIPFLHHSCIDLIKQLHEHKCCEHYRAVLSWHTEGFRIKAIYNVKQVASHEDQHKHDNKLVDTVTNHIAE